MSEAIDTARNPEAEAILSPRALDFVAGLQREFGRRRSGLLEERAARQRRFDAGELPDFLPERTEVSDPSWRVSPPPPDLTDRRVEITGPVDRKMMLGALNSPARGFMADFEDSCSPTWENIVAGQVNVRDAIRGTLSLERDGRRVELAERTATLLVRPRGWHLPERHFRVDGEPVSASLFDFGLTVFHGAREALERGSGPYFYLPKLENHLEARLWNDVFCAAEAALGIPGGSIRATVLIETLPAAFEMEEILYELREHSAGLNAGRWDYIFSVAKKLRSRPEFVLPDRSEVGMTAPFMRAYTELLVATCHRRGAHAMGGMAAFVPSRRHPEVTARALEKVAEDKRREAADGFDGTWVAHPDLIETATRAFDQVLGERPNQIERLREDVRVSAADLLAVDRTGGGVSSEGLRTNVRVGLQYLEAWLSGTGAVAIDHLMEDAATAEISRAQLWQWVRHSARLDGGEPVTHERVRAEVEDALHALRREFAPDWERRRFDEARKLFEDVALSEDFAEFLTLPAYGLLD